MKITKAFRFRIYPNKNKSPSSIRQSAVPALSTTILQENKKKKATISIR